MDPDATVRTTGATVRDLRVSLSPVYLARPEPQRYFVVASELILHACFELRFVASLPDADDRMMLKALLKDWVPPVGIRAIRSLRSAVHTATGRYGVERDAAFYDATFLAHEHWTLHYTESHYYPLWAVLADRIRVAPIGPVLDIGCGPGQLARLLWDHGVRRYCGLDFSPERLKRARTVCPEFEFVLADVFHTEVFDTRSYDTVVCTEFLEHVERDMDVLRRIRPGARVLATVPNFPGPGHVRAFSDAAEVAERYSSLLPDLRVDTHLASSSGTKYFLIDGVRG
jgi:2-polyprenyl-3-methyl-5-hydroxy-6-metoxy-1,4-benzoquinol methylase